MVMLSLRRESFGSRSTPAKKMAKISGRTAHRVSDVAARIDVVRDGAAADANRSRAASSSLHTTDDGDARLMHEVSEAMRAALVPDRIAEAVAGQIEATAGARVRVLLRQHLANELRALLRKHARNGFVEVDPADVLNDALADALAEGAAEAIAERFPAALRERLPIALRAATGRSAFVQRVGGTGVEDLADYLGAMAEATIRQRLGPSLRPVVRARLSEVARDDARELLRIAASPEDESLSPADQIASVATAIERATHDRVVRGIVERFRVLVAGSLHHATGERLGDGLRRTLASTALTGHAAEPAGRVPRPRVGFDGLGERLEDPLTQSIRAGLMNGLRERVETTCRENIDEVLRERLAGAIRVAIAEQRGSETVDVGRLAGVINYELAEVLRARICDGIRARTAEAVRTRLADAIRAGVSSTPIV